MVGPGVGLKLINGLIESSETADHRYGEVCHGGLVVVGPGVGLKLTNGLIESSKAADNRYGKVCQGGW